MSGSWRRLVSSGTFKRLAATVRREVTLQWRYGLYAVSVAMVLVWGVLLGLLRGGRWADAGTLVPVLLLVNVMVTTFYFVGALVLLEKDEGTLAATAVTPLSGSEVLLAKLVTLVALAAGESLLVVRLLLGAGFRWGLLLAGTLLLGALYVLAGFLSVVRRDSLEEWLLPSIVTVILLMLPLPVFLPERMVALPPAARGLLFLHPLAPPLALIAAACPPQRPVGGEIAYGLLGSLAWLGLAFAWARRRFERFVVRTAGG